MRTPVICKCKDIATYLIKDIRLSRKSKQFEMCSASFKLQGIIWRLLASLWETTLFLCEGQIQLACYVSASCVYRDSHNTPVQSCFYRRQVKKSNIGTECMGRHCDHVYQTLLNSLLEAFHPHQPLMLTWSYTTIIKYHALFFKCIPDRHMKFLSNIFLLWFF